MGDPAASIAASCQLCYLVLFPENRFDIPFPRLFRVLVMFPAAFDATDVAEVEEVVVPDCCNESTTPYIACPLKWLSVVAELTTMLIAFCFSIEINTFTPVHFVVPFKVMSAVPEIIVVPLLWSTTGADPLLGLKLVMSCVWRSVPST